jgi:hypothetical protein
LKRLRTVKPCRKASVNRSEVEVVASTRMFLEMAWANASATKLRIRFVIALARVKNPPLPLCQL